MPGSILPKLLGSEPIGREGGKPREGGNEPRDSRRMETTSCSNSGKKGTTSWRVYKDPSISHSLRSSRWVVGLWVGAIQFVINALQKQATNGR